MSPARPRRNPNPKPPVDRITELTVLLPARIRRNAWTAAADATDAIRELGDEINRLTKENDRLRAVGATRRDPARDTAQGRHVTTDAPGGSGTDTSGGDVGLQAATWARLVTDARVFLANHPQPEHVARLVWEAAVLGYVQGTQHAFGRSYDEQRADFPKDATIVAGVMAHATVDFEHFQALRQLAHASYHTAQEES